MGGWSRVKNEMPCRRRRQVFECTLGKAGGGGGGGTGGRREGEGGGLRMGGEKGGGEAGEEICSPFSSLSFWAKNCRVCATDEEEGEKEGEEDEES